MPFATTGWSISAGAWARIGSPIGTTSTPAWMAGGRSTTSFPPGSSRETLLDLPPPPRWRPLDRRRPRRDVREPGGEEDGAAGTGDRGAPCRFGVHPHDR